VAPVILLAGSHLRLVPLGPKSWPKRQIESVQSEWLALQAVHPYLFDGQMASVDHVKVADGCSAIYWNIDQYRYYCLRSHGLGYVSRCLFVSVAMLTKDGFLLVGRMNDATSSPGRWQLPGGNFVPPDETVDASNAVVVGEARREVIEETGLDLMRQEIVPWRLKLGGDHDDAGLIYKAQLSLTLAEALMHFAACVQSEQSEFSRLIGVSPDTGRYWADNAVDYLPQIVAELW
jgi:8-oxo-dGTP pyrophosphatase MutT (NUDIX family)